MNKERTLPPPEERYMTDVEFKRLVDTLENLIVEARYTPSELRDACLLAAIRYEYHRPIGKRIWEER